MTLHILLANTIYSIWMKFNVFPSPLIQRKEGIMLHKIEVITCAKTITKARPSAR